MTRFIPRSYVKISDTVVFGIPRSASSSHTVSYTSLLIVARIHSTFLGVLLVAGLPECGSLSVFSAVFGAFVPHFYLHCTHCVIPERLLNHPNSFQGGVFRLNTNLMQICCSPHSSHFECDIEYTCSFNSIYCPH